MIQSIAVYKQSHLVGHLKKQGRLFSFEYVKHADSPVSLTMPVREEAYIFPELHPIFQMHLPQGPVRQLLEHALNKAAGSGDLQLLLTLSHAQADGLQFAPSGEKPQSKTLLDDQNTGGLALFNQLLTKYTKNTAQAQTQPRINTSISGKAALPSAHYIIKTWGNEYPELAMNEKACLHVLSNMDVSIATATLSDKGKTLLSHRVDKTEKGEPLGFEDFCVLQGKTPKERYDSSWESVAKTIRLFVSPRHQSGALHNLFKLLLCNVMLRNGDAHLKNLALVYSHIGDRQCAPFFDITTTTVYLSDDFMGLSLNGEKAWPNRTTLTNFAAQYCGLRPNAIKKAFEQLEYALTQGRSELYTLSKQRPSFQPIAEQMEQTWLDAWQQLKE